MGFAQGYRDQGNDLRVTAGTTHLVNTTTGITARTVDTNGTGGPLGASAQTTFYTRMPDGRLLNARTPGAPAATVFYVTDQNKTVLGLIDATGARAGTYRYDAYGQTTQVEGTTPEAVNPFRWIGGYQSTGDQPGGYYKLGARFYNPDTAAFTQVDPEPGNMTEPLRTNPYLYSGGDPINNTDPTGRFFGEGALGRIAGGLTLLGGGALLSSVVTTAAAAAPTTAAGAAIVTAAPVAAVFGIATVIFIVGVEIE